MQKSPKVIADHDARYHQLRRRFTDAAPAREARQRAGAARPCVTSHAIPQRRPTRA
jgi:hypothetical protein